jgi:hypothetical protein
VRRILLVLSVVAVMAVMLAGTVGTALAQVQRGACKDSSLCRQAVLLPEEQKGNTDNPNVGFEDPESGEEYGQASNSCRSPGFDLRNERSFLLGGKGLENRTGAFVRCFPGPLPI